MKRISSITWVRVSLLVAIALAGGACTDHDYDFDPAGRDITLLGEDVTFPLGQAGPLTVQDLMGEKMAPFLTPLEDGTCAIQYQGKAVSFVFDELRNIDGAAPFQRFCDFPISYDFALFARPEAPAFDARGEADLSGSIPGTVQLQNLTKSLDVSISGLPAQLASLKALSLSQKSRLEITVSIPDCLLTGGTVTPDLTFDMGSFFESDDFPGGLIRIDSPLTAENGYSVATTIPLHKFALDPDSFNPSDHTLTVSASLKFSGTCAISRPRTNRDRHAKAPKDAKLHVTVIMRDIACQEIEGTFDYARKSQVTFALGDLSAGLADQLAGDVRFDFLAPEILLDIESNITIPISAQLELAARQNKVKYAEVKNIPFLFPVPEPGATAKKRLRLAKEPVQVPGEESVALDFTSLLSRIPDDMLITAHAATLSDRTAVLRIGENYRVSVSPRIIIPLQFGPDTRVAIRKTVAVPAQLGALVRKNTFQVQGVIDNGFPLRLAFSLVMVDADGAALTETVRQTLAADAASDISLTLAKLPEADLTQLASAVLSFEAEGIPDGRPVKTDDAIQVSLHAVIPGGIHLEL